ncbi:MAG: haloacid dehalogenase type II [Burkholderiaceae bacterium]|jgi:2-haloacid dehalogenase
MGRSVSSGVPRDLKTIKALCFDVFGTVVDWRGSLIIEVRALARAKGLRLDAPAFADAWRAGYAPAMNRVRSGELGWQHIDTLHRSILEELIPRFGLDSLSEVERVDLNLAWHRLRPWTDSVRGLKRLKRTHTIATLSNGNVSLLNDMAKNAGLPWDLVLSAELFRHYKPDPETYLGAAELIGVEPAQLMMVAAHKSDLRAAKACGLATALVQRPLEYGRNRHPDPGPDPAFDLNVLSFVELADRLQT